MYNFLRHMYKLFKILYQLDQGFPNFFHKVPFKEIKKLWPTKHLKKLSLNKPIFFCESPSTPKCLV